MKEVVVIWDKTFLGVGGGSDQITVAHLTVLLTSKEWVASSHICAARLGHWLGWASGPTEQPSSSLRTGPKESS